MAKVDLTKVWVNRLDTGEALSAASAPGRERAASKDVEVRSYAGGRQRSMAKVGTRGRFTFTLRLLTLEQVELLEAWMGVPVMVRDHKGQLFRGTFGEVPTREYRDRNRWDATLTLSTITSTRTY